MIQIIQYLLPMTYLIFWILLTFVFLIFSLTCNFLELHFRLLKFSILFCLYIRSRIILLYCTLCIFAFLYFCIHLSFKQSTLSICPIFQFFSLSLCLSVFGSPTLTICLSILLSFTLVISILFFLYLALSFSLSLVSNIVVIKVIISSFIYPV